MKNPTVNDVTKKAKFILKLRQITRDITPFALGMIGQYLAIYLLAKVWSSIVPLVPYSFLSEIIGLGLLVLTFTFHICLINPGENWIEQNLHLTTGTYEFYEGGYFNYTTPFGLVPVTFVHRTAGFWGTFYHFRNELNHTGPINICLVALHIKKAN